MIGTGLVRVPGVRLLLVLGLALSASCSGTDRPSFPSATVGTEPPRTTTTNPYAIPPVIDDAYVNRVLAAFDTIRGDVSRLVVQTKTIPPEAIDRLRSIYGKSDALQLDIDLLQDDMFKGFSDYKDPPGNQRTTVEHLITAKDACIFAQVQRDYSAVTSQPNPPPSRLWVVLLPDPGDIDPWGYNPTPWYLPYDGYQPGRVAPQNPCQPQ